MVRAFLDASVLYPVSLRNLLMRLTLSGLFEARWSADVHTEWIQAVRRNRPDIALEKLYFIRDAMDAHAEDCVVTGYEPLIETLVLPDPDDRHILAAALTGKASIIVTRNLKDFPDQVLRRHAVTPQHPDVFLSPLLDAHPDEFLAAVRDQQTILKNPPVSMDGLLALFDRIGLCRAVEQLRRLHNP